VRRVLYCWPELIAYHDATVFVCEGEKDADNVRALDLTATTVASGKWTQDCIDALAGRDCWIIQDVDINGAGDKKARNTANHLHNVTKSIKIVRLPGLTGDPGNKDVSDWLGQGHSKDELIEVCASTPDWKPSDDAEQEDETTAPLRAKQQAEQQKQSERDENSDELPPEAEDAIALAFADRHAHELRYVNAWGRWLSFDGSRWADDTTLHTFDRVRTICREIAFVGDKPARAVASAKTVVAVERLARADRRFAATGT